MAASISYSYQTTDFSNSNSISTGGIWLNDTSSGTIRAGGGSGSGGCNESSKFNNEQKALYHGLKSAYRMGQAYDGKEYGVQGDIPLETAAQIAANVAIAYFQTTGKEYTRRESLEYLRDNHDGGIRPAFLEHLVFTGRVEPSDPIDEETFGKVISHAWTQIDDKRNHYDAARTALAISEAVLGVRFEV